MSIKNDIVEKFDALSSEKEVRIFLNEIITALHVINENTTFNLVKEGTMTDERAAYKVANTDALLKQIVDNIFENIIIYNLNRKSKELEALKEERNALWAKVEKAKGMISEKDAEIEKTKKATKNEIKKKLQIGRDKVIAIAETSTALGERVSDSESMDILNNIRDNIGLLTSELISLGLWDEDELKPNIEPLSVKDKTSSIESNAGTILEEKPKKKATRKTTRKTDTEANAEYTSDEKTEEPFDSDIESSNEEEKDS